MKVQYTAESEKKTAKRKPSKRKLKPTFYIFICILAVGVLVALMLTVLFTVKSFDVDGASIYTLEEIKTATGIDLGDNLIRLPVKNAEENIEIGLPYIKKAEISRKFPSTVVISVTAAEEYLVLKDGDIECVADADYKVLKLNPSTTPELPVVRGVDLSLAKEGQVLEFDSADKENSLNVLLDMIESRDIDVTYFNVDDHLNLSAVIEDRVYVEFGSVAYIDRKFNLMQEAISKEPSDVQMMLSLKNWSVDDPKCVRTYRDVTGLYK